MAQMDPLALRRRQEIYLRELNVGNGSKTLSFALGDVLGGDGFGGLHANGTVVISVRNDPQNRRGYATSGELLEMVEILRRLASQLGRGSDLS